MEEYLKVDYKGNYAIIEFFHPAHNSLHSGMLQKLSDAINRMEEKNNVKCVLLKSGGNRTFCAGANFDELKAISNMEEGKKFFSGFGNVIRSMKNSSKLIVGRIQGKAVGGGVGLAAACDIAFATRFASIRLSELSIGIGPFVIEPAVSRKIGISGLSELTLKPLEWKDAYWAKDKGMYSEVFETTELLDEYLQSYIQTLSSYSGDAIVEIKKMLWSGTEHWDKLMADRAEISGKLVLNSQIL